MRDKIGIYGALICLTILTLLNLLVLWNIQSEIINQRTQEIERMNYIEARIEQIEIPEATHTVEIHTVKEICNPEDFTAKADEYAYFMRTFQSALLDEELNEGFFALMVTVALGDDEISEFDLNLLETVKQYFLGNP